MYLHLLLKLCCITRRAQYSLVINHTPSIHVITGDLIGWQSYTRVWTFLPSDISPAHFYPNNSRTFSQDKFPPNIPHGHAPPEKSPLTIPLDISAVVPDSSPTWQLSVTVHGLLISIYHSITYKNVHTSWGLIELPLQMLILCFSCVGYLCICAFYIFFLLLCMKLCICMQICSVNCHCVLP